MGEYGVPVMSNFPFLAFLSPNTCLQAITSIENPWDYNNKEKIELIPKIKGCFLDSNNSIDLIFIVDFPVVEYGEDTLLAPVYHHLEEYFPLGCRYVAKVLQQRKNRRFREEN